ncbi:MAG: hypothetical protein LC808_16770 [Actinobacteria bacterium]|nr:hypothetical protein [Actinomycetota bacterium]
MMLDYLARPEVIDTLCAAEHHYDHELTTIRGLLATAQICHEELDDAVAAGTLSVTLAARSEPAMLAEIARLEQTRKRTSCSRPHSSANFVSHRQDQDAVSPPKIACNGRAGKKSGFQLVSRVTNNFALSRLV